MVCGPYFHIGSLSGPPELPTVWDFLGAPDTPKCSLGPKVGIVYILGTLGFRAVDSYGFGRPGKGPQWLCLMAFSVSERGAGRQLGKRLLV